MPFKKKQKRKIKMNDMLEMKSLTEFTENLREKLKTLAI